MENKKLHVRTGDTVVVISGEDKGKQGKILTALPKEGRVIVEGVNMLTKHLKPRQMGQEGGIIHQEGKIDASNVKYFCKRCNQASKIGRKKLEDGTRVRYCKNCDETIND